MSLSLLITFEQSEQQIVMPEERRKANVTHLQKEQEGGLRELHGSQLHLDGNNPGNHFQACDRKEGDREWSAWIHKREIMLGQLDNLPQ